MSNVKFFDLSMTWTHVRIGKEYRRGWMSLDQEGLAAKYKLQDMTLLALQDMAAVRGDYSVPHTPLSSRLRRYMQDAAGDPHIVVFVGMYIPWWLERTAAYLFARGTFITAVSYTGREVTFRPKKGEEKLLFGWLSDIQNEANIRKEIRVLNEDIVGLAEAVGIHTEGAMHHRIQYIRQQLPDDDTIRNIVQDLAPLYDVEITEVAAYQHEQRYVHSRSGEVYLRCTNVPIQLEVMQVYIRAYLQIKWYLSHFIRPSYMWVQDTEPAYIDSTDDRPIPEVPMEPTRWARYTPAQCRSTGMRGRLRRA